MITIENVDVYGWEAAIRGMRNPMNSWDKSDSFVCRECDSWVQCENCPKSKCCDVLNAESHMIIGENDLKLMKSLSKAGNDHGKFLRFINVTVDITAPLYWWKEFDTYKVGTVANSCSTMHKIHDKEFTMDDFSYEHLIDEPFPITEEYVETYLDVLKDVVVSLNCARRKYLETKDKRYWWQMIQLLPSSYNQKRTVQLNYQVLTSMYHSRKNHKLDEWKFFCEWCETLPYFKEVCLNG